MKLYESVKGVAILKNTKHKTYWYFVFVKCFITQFHMCSFVDVAYINVVLLTGEVL